MTVNKMVKQNGKLTDLSKRHKSVKVTHKQISNPHSKATLKNRFKIRQNHGSLPRTNELSRDQKLLVGYNLKRYSS